jgi:hypothetical protein
MDAPSASRARYFRLRKAPGVTVQVLEGAVDRGATFYFTLA